MPSPQRPRHPGPSPLQQVQFSTELSETIPSHGQVRDPAFWRRFSTALLRSEGGNVETDSEQGVSSTVDEKYQDEWLSQQYKEKRKCRILCASITIGVALTIVTIFIIVYYFLKIRG